MNSCQNITSITYRCRCGPRRVWGGCSYKKKTQGRQRAVGTGGEERRFSVEACIFLLQMYIYLHGFQAPVIIWFILYNQSYSCYTLLENLTHLKFLQANHGFSCFCILMSLFLSLLNNFYIDSLLLLFSHVQLFATPWTAARQASLSFTLSLILLKLMSIESMMPSNRISLCHPLLLLPSIFPSIRDFSNEWVLCIRWPKY